MAWMGVNSGSCRYVPSHISHANSTPARVGRCRAAFWQENLSVSAAESLQAAQLGGTLQHCPIGALQVAIFSMFRGTPPNARQWCRRRRAWKCAWQSLHSGVSGCQCSCCQRPSVCSSASRVSGGSCSAGSSPGFCVRAAWTACGSPPAADTGSAAASSSSEGRCGETVRQARGGEERRSGCGGRFRDGISQLGAF